jgi:predicted NUDIX family phosphoesterase
MLNNHTSHEEGIMCFPREVLKGHLPASGVFWRSDLLPLILHSLSCVPRSRAERDETLKQLIVYVVIEADGRYLSYWRTPKTGENRLQREYSIGVGGHVNGQDMSTLQLSESEALMTAVWREVREEVDISSGRPVTPTLMAYINDDTTDVGRVHFGTVWLLRLRKASASPRGGKGIGRVEFLSAEQLRDNSGQYERWSQLLIEFMTSSKWSERLSQAETRH